ncbi:bacillithiol biosynthesis cysteine-adding enzyme BshC [Paenibacillus sp. YYML68]|uniref:bacillithiol biosynthesis cysteine-adding enzyme BshC n=1 Tax=Paenibacillus sp. YYML68 TaxID=2909250 RepID=UPI0024911F5D|nr:bacillithiol biosynthesis cysteine-adding enzyme BshC [Paenibacillus sp. YYML68]
MSASSAGWKGGGNVVHIHSMDWPTGQSLTDDYIDQREAVGALFDYSAWDRSDWHRRAEWIDRERTTTVDRGALADVLEAYNVRAGNAPEALEHVQQLRDPRTLCVVGGQQAGLFTGPLLVVYKAVTIIQAARIASQELQRSVVPVFWIAGEDHDFDEVDHTYYLSPELRPARLRIGRPEDVRTSVSRTSLTEEQWADALTQLELSLPPTEFKESVLRLFEESSAGAPTLVEAFARLLSALFGRHGLVLLDSDDPQLRRLEGPMFRRLIERAPDISEGLQASSKRVVELGYEPQVSVAANGLNLFVYDDRGERVLLYEDGAGGYTDRRGGRSFSRAQLLDFADHEPERLSNNVMTRPLMQDELLPVLGVVLGPSEVAYWTLTQGAFHALGMRMPLLCPRHGFTLLEGGVSKQMAKLGLSLDDVRERLDERRQVWLAAQDQHKLKQRFAEVKDSFRQQYEPLITLLGDINAGLVKLGETNLGKITEQIDYLAQKAEDGLRTQNETGLKHFAKIEQSLVPGGKLQERVYNVSMYLNKYGFAWLEELVTAELELDGKHRIYYL